MTQAIKLPGGTALLRDKTELRGRDKNLIQAAAMAAAPALSKLPPGVVSAAEAGDQAAAAEAAQLETITLTRSEAQALLELKECVAVALLVAWDLKMPDGTPRPLPTADTIGDLPEDLYTALCDEVAGIDTSTLTATDMGVSSDPDSPTTASESSSGPLEATAELTSTTE